MLIFLLSESVVPQVSPRVQFWVGLAVFHGLPLTTSHDSHFTANTVGLWLHSSGNGLHKKEVNPHVGTRPGPGVLTLQLREGELLTCHRGPLVATAWNYKQL